LQLRIPAGAAFGEKIPVVNTVVAKIRALTGPSA
jgi:hypothetical protein